MAYCQTHLSVSTIQMSGLARLLSLADGGNGMMMLSWHERTVGLATGESRYGYRVATSARWLQFR
jgi:hypothetical protein